MSEITRERLFGFRHAFDDPVTVVLTLTALTLFMLAPVLILVATRSANSTSDKERNSGIVIGPGSGWRCSSWFPFWRALSGRYWPWPR